MKNPLDVNSSLIQFLFFKKFTDFFKLVVIAILLILPQPTLCHNGSDEKDEFSSALVESNEDIDILPEYLDDEVRFVTQDDFLIDEERPYLNQDVVDQSRSGYSLQYERCPPLPEPSFVASSGLCDAKRCQRDDECSRDGTKICCYNGCGYTCLPKVNPPLAFDWIEETDLNFAAEGQATLLSNRKSETTRALHAELNPEQNVVLPGGCLLSTKQYDDLVMFRTFDHVHACSCNQGEVACEITHRSVDVKG